MESEFKFKYSMLTPTIIILAILSIFPVIYSIFHSFTDYYYLSSEAGKFIGIENYKAILKDPYFQQALFNTLQFMILAVIFETALGLAFAVLVKSFKKAEGVLKILLLLPNLLPPVTVALVWQMMLSNNGIANNILSFIHLKPINWLADPSTAFGAILVIDIWQWTPFAFLLLYAMMQGISESQYEAAEIDGAGKWEQFRYITIPNLISGIALVVLLRTIDTFRLFDKVNILTKGGPANSTATITQYIYLHGVLNLKIGYGSAASILMTLLVMVISILYVKQALAVK